MNTDNQKFYGTIKLIKLVAHCLSVLKLDLPIRVACNLYAVDMTQTDTDDPFDQAYCDFETFYLKEDEPDLDFVLRSILETFNARISQAGGRWNIVAVEEMSASYDYRDFDKEGNYVANGTYNPVVEIDYPTNEGELLFTGFPTIEMRPGYGELQVLYNLGLKPNILENGDFRLTFTKLPENPYNLPYSITVNKEGWTLVNAGYAIQEGYESIDENNVAYTLTSGEDTLEEVEGGNAYLQSAQYEVKMGSSNQLKIKLRCKVNRVLAQFGASIYTIEVPYVKVRIRVKYGSLYLQANGTWGSTENKLTFFLTEWDKYTDFEIIALQPTSGTPTSGMDFDVRVYHAYAYHAEFDSIAALKAFPTYSGGEKIIPYGHKTELRDDFTLPSVIRYYELKDTTDPDNSYSVIEPTDYTSSGKWVLIKTQPIGGVLGTNTFPFHIDKVEVKFLTAGKEPIDAIQRTAVGEAANKQTFKKELILGSYSNLITTESGFGFKVGALIGRDIGSFFLNTTTVLSADTIYAGFLRDENGVGYELWARDSVTEEDKLHGIWLKQYVKQYRRSWRLLRGSVLAQRYFTFIDVAKNVNDSNRIYLPMGLELNDKRCIYSGEFLELITDSGSSDGGGSSPYSSAFSTGYGSSGFN
jgi:hypothetical protein